MIEFYLNNEHIETNERQGLPLLDFIRLNSRLKGTKIGCREGDCGACTVLIGKIENGALYYYNITSCLTPLINVHGCHVVTVEGLKMNGLNIAQKMIVKHNGSQCGFCTPGFVTSMMGNVLPKKSNEACSIDGNICRCTGYKSIEKAYEEQEDILASLGAKGASIDKVIELNLIPGYFKGIESKLKYIKSYQGESTNKIIGGGTDLLVQRPELILDTPLNSLSHLPLPQITEDDINVYIDAHSTPTDLSHSGIIQKMIPEIKAFMKLVSSAPIRNIGTISGNIVNASPIGDLTAFFHGLDASLVIINHEGTLRTKKMSSFFLDYKKIDLQAGERITQLIVRKEPLLKFNFEKVSKRQHLDIATVNTALSIEIETNSIIKNVYVSAGGVGPTPMRLMKTEAFLKGKTLNGPTILDSLTIVDEEIKPISDVRGSAEYKRLLFKQLYKAHFVSLYPHIELDIFKTV